MTNSLSLPLPLRLHGPGKQTNSLAPPACLVIAAVEKSWKLLKHIVRRHFGNAIRPFLQRLAHLHHIAIAWSNTARRPRPIGFVCREMNRINKSVPVSPEILEFIITHKKTAQNRGKLAHRVHRFSCQVTIVKTADKKPC